MNQEEHGRAQFGSSGGANEARVVRREVCTAQAAEIRFRRVLKHNGGPTMNQLKFTHVSSWSSWRLLPLIGGLSTALGCGTDDRSPGVTIPPAPESSEPPSTPGENDSTEQSDLPGEAELDEVTPADGTREGQPEDVELTPQSMETQAASAPSPPTSTEAVDSTETDQTESSRDGAAEDGAPTPSAGCGSSATVDSGRFTINVDGAQREYILELPDNYDANRPYRLIFGWHWRGGTAQQVADGFYGLEQRAEGSAIFVSPEGLDAGWANPGGRDIAFLDAMLERFESNLCIDESRIFSTGWSYGGMMSFAVACARGNVFRAIAPMSGALYSGCADGDVPVAVLGFHGNNDDVVPIGNGEAARDVFVGRNGCEPGAAVEADGCQRFEGCAEDAPVTWCEFNGGHTPAPGSEQAIWDFFAQF